MDLVTKYRMYFFIFNMVYLAIGVSMVGFGLYSTLSMNAYGFFSQNSFIAGACIFVVVGVLKVIFSILGMVATFVKSKVLYGIYVSGLIFLMMWTFIAAIYGFQSRVSTWDITTVRLTQAYAGQGNVTGYQGSNVMTDIMTVQNNFNCCGVDGDPGSIPCTTTRPVQNVFGQGCLRHLGLFFVEELYQLGAIGMAFGVVEITSFIVAMQSTQGLF